MNWSEVLGGNTKGIDQPFGKIVFILAVIAISLLLLVHRLDLKWIARISMAITFCLLYYILTINIRYNIEASTISYTLRQLGAGIYFTLISSSLTMVASFLGRNHTTVEK